MKKKVFNLTNLKEVWVVFKGDNLRYPTVILFNRNFPIDCNVLVIKIKNLQIFKI